VRREAPASPFQRSPACCAADHAATSPGCSHWGGLVSGQPGAGRRAPRCWRAAGWARAEVCTLSRRGASRQATLRPRVLCLRKELPSPHVTCQAAQASVSQPSIFFDFFQLLQVQTQLSAKEPQQNTSAPEAHALGLLSGEGKHASRNNPRHGKLNLQESLHPPTFPSSQSSSPAPGPRAAQLIGKQFSPSSNVAFPRTRFP